MRRGNEMCAIRTVVLAVGAVLLLHATPAWAQYNFCFGPTIQRSVPNPVLADGKIADDVGWLNAFTYRGGDGTPDANIRLVGNTFLEGAHKWIALGVEAFNDTQFDKGDAIVILYKIKNQDSYGQIVVAPLQDDQVPGNIVNPRPGSSKYYTSVNGSTWIDAGDAPIWVTWGASAATGGGACTAASPGTACSWTVEIGIDTKAAGAPSDLERFYVDVLEITNRNPVQGRQFSWPPGNKLVDVADSTLTPATDKWGTASVGSTSLCKGVFFGYADISAAPLGAGGKLTPGVEETFTVNLHNSASNAQGVKAHFAHAPFGVCGLNEACFVPFGSTSTPTNCPNGSAPPNCCAGVAGCIPPDPNNAGTSMRVKWTPTAADAGHQCIRVKLEATVGDTTFVNQGDFHNMWVAQNSTVSTQARINMKKVPPPVGGGPQRVRLAGHTTTQYAFADGRVQEIPVGTLTAQIIRQYKGARYTGEYVTVAGVRSEVWEPIGSYGYQLQHSMSPEFQKSFVDRHAALLREYGRGDVDTGSEPSKMRDLRAIRAINLALARQAERPAHTDWTFKIDNVRFVPNTRDEAFEVEVPVDGEVILPTVVTYGTGPVCSGCCCPQGAASKTTPSKVVSLGMIMLAGAVIFRRRRRR